MSIFSYLVPAAVILVAVFIMMPIMKKKAAEANMALSAMKDVKVVLFMLAGTVESVNGVDETQLMKSNGIYAIDQDGPMTVTITPHFTHKETSYSGTEPMDIAFEAKAGKSYEISVSNKEPQVGGDIVHVTPLVSDALVFKSKFFVITRDITETSQAKSIRGTY